MANTACIEFLQEALPQVGLSWPGFRKVHRLLCKRLSKRLIELRLPNLILYRAYLSAHAEEWRAFDASCRIPISRFYRDRAMFDALEHEVLPGLAERAASEQRDYLACWSAGCASGEEPYSLAALWHLRLQRCFPRLALRILATDVDAQMIERARRGCYAASSVKEVPTELRNEMFAQQNSRFCVREALRTVEFLVQDIRQVVPAAVFDLILCRNAVFTYFAPALQRSVLEHVIARLRPGGALAIGVHESLPAATAGLQPWPQARAIYRKGSPAFDVPDRSATTSSSSTCRNSR